MGEADRKRSKSSAKGRGVAVPLFTGSPCNELWALYTMNSLCQSCAASNNYHGLPASFNPGSTTIPKNEYLNCWLHAQPLSYKSGGFTCPLAAGLPGSELHSLSPPC